MALNSCEVASGVSLMIRVAIVCLRCCEYYDNDDENTNSTIERLQSTHHGYFMTWRDLLRCGTECDPAAPTVLYMPAAGTHLLLF